MKNIAALIDFTDGSVTALKQAAALCAKTGAQLHAVHIVPSQDKVKPAEAELSAFLNTHGGGLSINPVVATGILNQTINGLLNKVNADLVLICTHGIKGMFQHLFGAQILKLVQAITLPCIVIHENTTGNLSEAKKILFPIGPHPDFAVKIRQTAALAQILQATVVIYEIDRDGADADGLLQQNAAQAKTHFDQHHIAYTHVREEVRVFSVGFSRQTMEYAKANQIPVMSMMASVSKNDTLFGFGDKENFLVNDQGISVLTCNA